MDIEHKVKIEETSINLSCVKKEMEEEELKFEEKQYRIPLTLKNMFVQNWVEQRNDGDSLIGFSDGDVIMKTESGIIKEENNDLSEKQFDQSHCNQCDGSYQGYCINCSSLSHILNNVTPNLHPNPILNTTPINILEIREISKRQGVFALKTLPKGIILGPFEDVISFQSTNSFQWKIKNGKVVSEQNANWMKYIENITNHASKNLDVFQFDGILYFETSRKIEKGEELLVCYGVEEEMSKSSSEEEIYLIPVKKEEFPTVFACTLCCLGFRLERCLVEHKSKWHEIDYGSSNEDVEIIQCHCCNVWLDKQELLASHILHCLEYYQKLYDNEQDIQRKPTVGIEETIDSEYAHVISKACKEGSKKKHKCSVCFYQTNYKRSLKMHILNRHSNTNEKKYKCTECLYQTNYRGSLKTHLNTHYNSKLFECEICKKKFTQKGNLNRHILNRHSNTNEKKYKCPVCLYQTYCKGNLKTHLNTHNNTKLFECEICKKRFTVKANLRRHLTNIHSNSNEKEYKFSEYSYQTNHNECDICKKKFTVKSNLKRHIRDHHSNTNEKKYKCPECLYQTYCKGNLKIHLSTHYNNKLFECDICKKKFAQKSSLKKHIMDIHLNMREHQCSECSYGTNHKCSLKKHLNTHECDICKKKFTLKGNLRKHIKDRHSNTNEKKYKCTECSYQTNYKSSLKNHLNTHYCIKAFECDICKKKFTQEGSLKRHITDQHSNTNEKEYKCTECSYQTNRKDRLSKHINIHNIKPLECDI